MKRYAALAIVVMLSVLCLIAPVGASAAEANKFYFDKTVQSFFEGESFTPPLIRQGDCREEGTLTFTSSRPDNASVDENGTLFGESKGSAVITATLTTSKRTWKCTIEVNVIRKVTDINVTETNLTLFQPTDPMVCDLLNNDSASRPATGTGEVKSGVSPYVDDETYEALPVMVLRVGKNQGIQPTLLPTDANNRRYVLTTSNTSIVRVDGTYLIPKAAGECLVTVQSIQNPEVYRAYRALVIQPITGLKLSSDSGRSTYVGETLQLTPAYSPSNASIQAVTWSSSNDKVATVDEYGTVYGVKRGTATIKATAADGSGRYATYEVTVLQQPTDIELSSTALTVNAGSYKTLKATVYPSNANDTKVSWYSSDERIAKVNSSGRVTGVSAGTCIVTCASTNFSNVYASAIITVQQPVTKVSFTEKSATVGVGDTINVYWDVQPSTATDSSVTLTTSNSKIATVDQYGTVYGLSRGECTITATANDGSQKKGTIKITVTQPVTGVYMKEDQLYVGVDESITATAVLEPSNASITGMLWTVGDLSIATVRGNGPRATVTGRAWGTTVLKGVTNDGGYTTYATINVGDYNKALKITDLYLLNDQIKIVVENESNLVISRFNFTIDVYDMYGRPLACNTNGSHTFNGSYSYTLYEGDTTRHGRFYFGNFVQPVGVGRVVMRLTSYRTEDGYTHTIPEKKQIEVVYTAPGYNDQGSEEVAPKEIPILLGEVK